MRNQVYHGQKRSGRLSDSRFGTQLNRMFPQPILSSMAAVTNFFSMCLSIRWDRNLRRSAPRWRGQDFPANVSTGERNISAATFLESEEISVLASRLS